MASITINGIAIDTSAPRETLAAFSLANENASTTDYIVVVPHAPMNAAQKQQLARAGAEVLEAVPGGGLVCYFPKTSLARVRALPFVDWADLYPNVVKLSPSLRRVAPQPGGVAVAAAALAPPAELDSSRVTVDVVLHRNARVAEAHKLVAAAAHLDVSAVTVAGHKLRVTLKRRRLPEVAALDPVRHVEEVFPRRLANNIARTILRAPAAADPAALRGDGEVVAVADTGFDKGSTTNVHPAFKGRVKALYALGRPGRKDDPDGHGTHVAGSVLGDGVSSTDGAICGAAPGARLVLQSVLDSQSGLGGLPGDLNDLFLPPYKTHKARVHTNSWCSQGNFGKYDPQAHEVDEFVYKNRDMLICFAAGNAGTDSDANGQVNPSSVPPPGTAKNCLTIGASENDRPAMKMTYGAGWPADFPTNPIKSDRLANNPEGMVAFSSRGPTMDLRFKPDVVAPGTYILSTRSRATRSEGWGLSGDPLYMFDGGTSMATPLVAGCAAVVRQFLRTRHRLRKPSAALVKALIINGARPLAGQYSPSEAGAVPNNNQGFGRVDLQAVTGPYADHETLQFFDEATRLDTGEREDYEVTIAASARRLKVTLVWTDPPGEGLQSDLDLVVVAGGREWHGNMALGATDFDRVNNVEQVEWNQIPAGSVTVSVVAHAIALAKQNYALVIRVGG
ncbi:S8 family serine peptidase [Cupriavidus sp. 2TAF22]|uniref:S8 family serine peptidase n=1 Tax=unclassified Cupriavidus TaxID=2640874 RepID=UPI003F8EE39B